MLQPRPSGPALSTLHDVQSRGRPMPLRGAERRDSIRRAAVMRRIAAEFSEMPGLVLSVPQASRLLGLDEEACERILAALAREGLLRRRAGGGYGCA
jgi:hypothetical protein